MIVRGWRWGGLGLALAGVAVAFWPRSADMARARVDAGDFRFAVPYLETYLAQHPGDPWGQQALLRAYAQAGLRRKALQRLANYGQVRPLQAHERRWVSRWALAEGEAGLAIEVLMGPHEPQPSPELLAQMTDYALMAGQLKRAEALASARAKALPLDPEAQARAAEVALAAADPQGAVLWQSKLVALRPGHWKGRTRLAELLVASGKPLAGVAALEGHLPDDDDEAFPWHQKMARWATWGKAPRLAVKHLEAMWAFKPDSDLALALLQAYMGSKSPKAPDFAEAQAKRYMADQELGQVARQVLVDAKQEDRAMLLAQAQLRARPGDAKTHEDLVSLALGKQRFAIAAAELERWMALHPLDLETAHRRAQLDAWDHRPEEAYRRYADILRGTRQLDRGRELAWREEMLGVTPVDLDVQPEALANLSRLVALKPNQSDWRRRLAATLLNLGDHQGAIAQRQAMLGLPGATRQDVLDLATWLGWYDRLGEGLALLQRLHEESALDAGTLREAGMLAARNSRWREAAYFMGQAAGRAPQDPVNWEQLARIQEVQGDAAGAARSWGRHLALKPGEAARMRASALLSRKGRLREALAFLKSWGDRLELAELRERVALAVDLEDRQEQEAAWKVLLSKAPQEGAGWVAYAQLLELRGARLEASVAFRQAWRRGQGQGEVMGNAALGLLTTEGPEAVRPWLPALEALPERNEGAARALVELLATEHPARALGVLEALHAKGGGGADTWFRQAELGAALGRFEARGWYERAYALAQPQAGADANAAELAAYALDRLGREEEAQQLWLGLTRREPGRMGPHVALARKALQANDSKEALAWARLARKAAPQALEARLVEAEAALLAQHLPDAEAILGPLHEERPELSFVTSQLAAVRFEQGLASASAALLREALGRQPHDKGLMAQYLGARDRGRSSLDAYARLEQQQVLNRWDAGLRSELRLGPDGKPGGPQDGPWRLTAEAGTLQVQGTTKAQVERVAAGVRGEAPGWEAGAQLELSRLQGQVRAPLGELRGARDWGRVRLEGRVAEARWTDANEAVAQDGRERRVGATLRYRPNPRVQLGLSADAGRLLVGGVDRDWLHDLAVDGTFRRDPADPFYLLGQVRTRGWGQASGLVGLPPQVRYAALMFGWAERFGPMRVELQPGWVASLDSGQHAPSAAGSLAVDPWPDFSMELGGIYSPGALAVGLGGGSYSQAQGALRYRF